MRTSSDVGVGSYVGGSRTNNDPRRRCAVDRKAVDPLPPGGRVPRIQGVGGRNSAWVILLVHDAISVEFRWKEDIVRFKP